MLQGAGWQMETSFGFAKRKGIGIVAKMRRIFGKTAAWFAVAALALSIAGCSKQRAELALKKAKNNVGIAKGWEAAKFDESKAAFEQAGKLVAEAEGQVAGAPAQALTTAQEAVKQSKAALDGARTRFADQRRTEARNALEVARKNDGQQENAKLYEEASAMLTKAEERYNKQKYEDAITNASQAIDKVEQLLASLKNNSTNMLADLKQKQTELRSDNVKADQFLPNAIIKLDDSVNQIDKLINTDRDYKQAIIKARAAAADAEANINESKKRHSRQWLTTLESGIAEAISEEAPIYAPEQLKPVQESFEDTLKGFYDNQFDSVLQAARDLKPKVDKLILVTRIEATRDKIATVNRGVTNFKDQDIERYLPGRVKAMEDLSGQAQDLFNNADYNGAKEKANQGLVEQDRITAEFDSLAEKTIATAQQAYDASRQTFDKMLGFFTGATAMVAVDQRIDARRQTETADLGSRLSAALDGLNKSKGDRAQRQFRKSIEQAKDVQGISDAVMNGTFKVVAEHALLSIQDEVSALERQGAREEASKQLNQVQQIVEQAQKLINEKQNREAAEYTAKARSYLENVKQQLARRAVEEKGRADDMIRRLEGGAGSSTPAAGGREYPGGSDLGNKEAMFAEVAAIAASPAAALTVAQATVPQNQSYVGAHYDGAAHNTNRQYPQGTFMTDQPWSAGNASELNTGAPTGAIIGTQPEPVVNTHEAVGQSSSRNSYEGTNGAGPFVATGGGAAPDMGAGGATAGADQYGVQSVTDQVYEILMDDQRVVDIQKYQPNAINVARAKLKESADALAAGDYSKALAASKEAQRVIIDAELKAARAAARQNLKMAADRINLAEASGAAMFAPAQLSEAINLYNQAESMLTMGESIQARDLSQQALVASDDARLYNVNKARDLAGLSTRYSGWKSSGPELLSAEQGAAIAEDLLRNPATAAQGQAIAQQAVVFAQVALDKSRDYSFQERIDNIYKALNTALRAGANYFNVAEVKRLIAELATARDEYCTRNYDGVELKLKDIEARLARVIETTPLVLQENLTDLTEKLNALVVAGAENYNAQEVDDVKSLMTRSAIDFRKHDYYSSYSNLKSAMKLVDLIEERLQVQVYYDAVTELFAQMDKAVYDFRIVLNRDRVFIKKLVSTETGQPASIALAGSTSPNVFKDRVNDIYLRAIHLKPPKGLEGTHDEVIVCIKYARASAENFQKLYLLDSVSKPDAYDIIDTAYNQYNKSKLMRGEIQVRLIDPEARMKVIQADKIVNY